MKIVSIALEKLIAHPANANVMSEAVLKKLGRHIAEQGCYEPLAVRKHPVREGCFEIINGHHRKKVLEELQYSCAGCVVWDVSDEQTLMLLSTLNRLRGQDDAIKRAKLLERLSQRFEEKSLLQRLPETKEQLQKLLALKHRPRPVDPETLKDMPRAMIFFVVDSQRKIINRALREVGQRIAGEAGDEKLSRGDLLAVMAAKEIKN